METVGEGALLIANHARHHSHDGVGHHGSSQLATRHHIVANRYLACDEVLANAVVDALVVSAEDDDVLHHRQLVGHMLVELLAVGRSEYHLVVVALSLQGRDAAVDGLALHHHSGKSAIGVVVHAAPLVERVVAQIVQMYFGQAFLFRTCQNRLVDESLNHLWQHGDNVYSHSSVFLSAHKGTKNLSK